MQKYHANGTYHDILKAETCASLFIAANELQIPPHCNPGGVNLWYQSYS